MKKYVVALDQGTSSSRAIVFDKAQNIIASAQKEFTQIYPKPGWVEHDPMEIYSSQYAVMMEALTGSGISPEEVAAIGITNQRETTILWEKKTGKPVCNAIVWQCRRTAPICEDILKDKALSAYIKTHTGLLPDAYFSATKIKWILDEMPHLRQKAKDGEILFGTVDSWLVWKLSEGKVHITDYTNASRTMLYDIRNLCWDKKICDALDIPMQMLPEVRNSSEIYATVNLQGTAVPIAGIAGDQQAALFGQACFFPGQAKNTYGTGCFLLMHTGENMLLSDSGMLTTIAVGLGGKVEYALEGSVFVGGAVIQWVRDQLRFVTEAADTEYFATKVEDNGGVYLVPAFTGLGAPHWDMYARGAIFGLTRGSGRDHIIRAALESIAYQTYDVLMAMQKDLGHPLTELRVDGGASANRFLMQFQADLIETEVLRPKTEETTALGAAYLAGLATGIWKDKDEIQKSWSVKDRFSPQMPPALREKFLAGWHKAVQRASRWEEE